MRTRASASDKLLFRPDIEKTHDSDHLSMNVRLVEQNVNRGQATLMVDVFLKNELVDIEFSSYRATVQYNLKIDGTIVKSGSISSSGGTWDQIIMIDQGFLLGQTDSYKENFKVEFEILNATGEFWYDVDGGGYVSASERLSFSELKLTANLKVPKLTKRAMIVDMLDGVDNNDSGYNKIWYSTSITYGGYERFALTLILYDLNNKRIQFVRELPTTNLQAKNEYTFVFTDEEIYNIRSLFNDSTELMMDYQLATYFTEYQYDSIGGTAQNDYVVGAPSDFFRITPVKPTISNIVVKDTNSTIIALTGDENIMVNGESNAEYQFDYEVYKEATVKQLYVKNDIKIKEDMTQGLIENVISPNFEFVVVDSRDLERRITLEKPFVPYSRPTCVFSIRNYFEEDASLDTTRATIELSVAGHFYNGSFGAVDNELKIQLRHTDENGEMGAWKDIDQAPTIENNRYSLVYTVNAFTYNTTYTFQFRAIDKLYTAITQSQETTIKPVFDWNDTDFNFNVPVKMHEETVLRHNIEDEHTILSASGGRIHLRPNGTSNERGQAILQEDGSLDLSGPIRIDGVEVISSGDYVIDFYTEAMGTNGTWYCVKWKSGRAECYGVRNFGTMAVTTSWGGLYRSNAISQQLPSELFIGVPRNIQMSLLDADFGGWICRHETTAPSKTSTGSFIVVRPASATLSRSNVCFHVIGMWKEIE